MLKIRVVCIGNFKTFNAYLIRHTKFESDFFLYTINLLNERFKPVFEYQITFWICVLVLSIHKGYCVVKILVRNVHIKAFWYTKIFNSQILSNYFLHFFNFNVVADFIRTFFIKYQLKQKTNGMNILYCFIII